MTDKEISNYFTKATPMLEKIARGVAYKYNKKYIHPHTAINESYLYIYEDKMRNKYKNEDELQRIVINYIKMMTIWNSVSFDKLEKISSYEWNGDNVVDDTDESLNDKIEIELWFNERRCILDMYRNQEEDKVKQIIFDCYFNKNITRGTEMAKHLGINKDYACKYIRNMKDDIRNFFSENKR